MEKLYPDIAVSLFFVVALVLMARTEKKIKSVDRKSFRYVAGGLTLLAVLSLLSALNAQKVFDSVPVLSDPVSIELIQLMTLIAGLVLTTAGVARWLPAARRYRVDGGEETKQVLLSRKLTQALVSNEKFDVFLAGLLNWLHERLESQFGAVYTVTTFNNRSGLIASCGSLDENRARTNLLELDSTWFQNAESGKLTLLNGRTAGCFPVRASEQTTILFQLWSEGTGQMGTLDRYEEELIERAVLQRISVERKALRDRFRRMCQSYSKTTMNAISNLHDKNEMLLSAVRALRDFLPAELLSVTIAADAGTGTRLTVGATDTVLNEVGINVYNEGSYLSEIHRTKYPLLLNSLEESSAPNLPRLYTVSGMKSIIAVPLELPKELMGVLTIASSGNRAFTRSDVEIARAVSPAFTRIAEQIRLEQQMEKLSTRERIINEFLTEASKKTELREVFRLAADTISSLTGVQLTRISTFENENEFLSSRALKTEIRAKSMVPDEGYMVLSIMPLHRAVRDKGEAIVVDCSDPDCELSEAEISQAFVAGITTAAIIPVKRLNRLYGFISLADARVTEGSLFGEQNLRFFNAVASVLALMMEKQMVSTGLQSARNETLHRIQTDPGREHTVRRRLRSSLTGIIGSLEMIKSGDINDELRLNRFLSIIDKSARKLNEYLED